MIIKYTNNVPQKVVEVNLPASKSISNRVLILNALSDSPFPIQNLAQCDDTDALLSALESNDSSFDIGAAGTAMRFLTAYLSKIGGVWSLTGSERMKNRPIAILVDALNRLGANIGYLEKEGFPPLSIRGRALVGGEIELDASVSSQYISALMMIAPTMRDGLTIRFATSPISMPYIRMTANLLSEFGIRVSCSDTVVSIAAGQEFRPVAYTVESDWSAASYWYEMVALSPCPISLYLPGLTRHSSQGDSEIVHLFEQLGVTTKFEGEGVLLRKEAPKVRKLVYNFTDVPDLTQTLVVSCCGMGLPFYFSGLQSLKIKETNRVEALIKECGKLGFVIVESEPNVLEFKGERLHVATAAAIETYEDHRMAMSFAPMAFVDGCMEIEKPEVVSKSYPQYWQEIAKFFVLND